MYVVKNALRCIGRAKGRSVLIGIIILAITLSACLGLSIRQAAESAKKETLEGLSVTATISYDRQSAMKDMKPSGQDGEFSFDRSQFDKIMNGASSLSLEEYEKYAKAESVQNFSYSLTASVNGTDDFEPIKSSFSRPGSNSDDSDSGDSSSAPSMPGNLPDMGGFGGGRSFSFGQSGDFSLIGYSSEEGMTSFINGTSSITDGEIFEQGTDKMVCIISDELATYNSISVGGKILISNPNDEEETYELKVVGIYTSTDSNASSFSFSAANDSANRILMSYETLNTIISKSESVATTSTDENTGIESSTKISSTLSGTYRFASVDDYNLFENQCRELGLNESYSVSSNDLNSYESSLVPLNTLSKLAGYFLIVILAIGAVILVVLNLFIVRERKYEIGVLTAMGMKKGKVAAQFMCEILAITIVAVIIGSAIGAVSSVPVTNKLLESQIESTNEKSTNIETNFGRGNRGGSSDKIPSDMGGFPGGRSGGFSGSFGSDISGLFGVKTAYVTEVSSAMNITVLLEVIGISLILVLLSGGVAMLFVMRYDPLKILANRD